MKIIDLTCARKKQQPDPNAVPVVVRSVEATYLVPLERLVTLATVVDVRSRANPAEVDRRDVARTPVADIGGCIIYSGWCDSRGTMPVLTVDAAAYLLEGGVRTVASDFPIVEDAADMLLHNNCVLVHCLSNIGGLSKPIVRLIALPLKYEDSLSADARVIAIED
jgi:kynurenine formamidase